MTTAAGLTEAFHSLFDGRPRIYRAPGRVNLIGEHTDYNEGIVMPAAIDFSTWVAIETRADRRIILHSENFSETRNELIHQAATHPDEFVLSLLAESSQLQTVALST